MFQKIKTQAADVRTIAKLCLEAEQQGLRGGQREPAAEHFLLAAFDLPDGSAASVLRDFGVDRSMLVSAIEGQYADALGHADVSPDSSLNDGTIDDSMPEARGLYEAAASGKAVIQALSKLPRVGRRPLRSADILIALASLHHGIVPRVFRRLGLDLDQVAQAAKLK